MERADLEQWRPKDVARLLALVETQRRYFQEIVASIPVGLLVLSPDLEIILANAAARKLLGLADSGSLRVRMDTILPGWVLERVGQALKSGTPQTNLVVEGEAPSRRRLRIGISVVRSWEEAEPEAVLAIEDLSAGLAMGQAAAPSASRAGQVPVPSAAVRGIAASELVDNLEAVVWAVELGSMRFLFVSQHAEELLGFPADFWINNPSFWADRVHPADRERVTRFYQRAIEQRQANACEFRAMAADGRVVWLRETVRVAMDSEGRPVLLAGISVDVTERRLLEQHMVQAERIEAVTKLASRMAHDLNNMLMILTGYSEELLSGLPPASPLRAEVQEILTAAERISGLTAHLLAFTRKQAAAAETIELEPVVSAVAERLGVEWKGSLRGDRVRANAGQMEPVLTAVIEAARKMLQPQGRITVEISSVEIREELQRAQAPLRRGEYAAITIAGPNGRGEVHLNGGSFERFLPEKDPADDTAARLAQAYGMVRQWGGDIGVANGAADGWLYRIFLERVAGPPGAPAPPRVEEAGPAPAGPGLETVLVVEDENGIRSLVRKFLSKHGFEVLEAANGEQALALVREFPRRIDLLITDMMMPQMGGRELVDRLHQQGRDMKILYISGYTDDASVYAAELPPGSAFLQKPFTLNSLLEKVRAVLNARS
ncbi:MAG: response regulator [Acidobacteriia bacterium]|nr:response regulator [Terriglobia bacterium]